MCLIFRSLLLIKTNLRDFFFKVKLLNLAVFPSRRICCDDHSFPPEKENWLFCYSNIPAMHNDRHSVPSLLLAQQRVCASQDCLW